MREVRGLGARDVLDLMRRRRHELATTMRHRAWSGDTLQRRVLQHTRLFFPHRAGPIALLRVHPDAAREVLAIRDRKLESGPILSTEENLDSLLWFATKGGVPWRDGARCVSVLLFPHFLRLDRTPAGVDVLACVPSDFAMRVEPERLASLAVLEGLRQAERERLLDTFRIERVPVDEAEAAQTAVARSTAGLLRNMQRGRSDARNCQWEQDLFNLAMRLPSGIECKKVWRPGAWGPELEAVDLGEAVRRVAAEAQEFASKASEESL